MSLIITPIKPFTLRNQLPHTQKKIINVNISTDTIISVLVKSGELKQEKNAYKSESAGVRGCWKFALYHLNSSYWSCQEWIAVAQREAEGNLCYCVIFLLQTNQTELFFWNRSQVKSPLVGHEEGGRERGKKKRNKKKNQTKRVISCMYAAAAQACPDPFCAQIEQSVKQSDTSEWALFLPVLQLVAGLCWTQRERERDIAVVPLSHAELLQ